MDWRAKPSGQPLAKEPDVAPVPRDAGSTQPGKLVHRPEKQLFHLAMAGMGSEEYHMDDFPWKGLGEGATVVDVGGGLGKFSVFGSIGTPHSRLD